MADEKVELVTIRLFTKLGAEYVFPDVEKQVAQQLPGKGSPLPEVSGQLTLVNASISLLSVPVRIIEKIYIGEELWWDCPA